MNRSLMPVLLACVVSAPASIARTQSPTAQAPAGKAQPASQGPVAPPEQKPSDPRFQIADLAPDAARTAVGRGVQFLLDKQNADGSWATSTPESMFELNYSNASFFAWKLAGGALCCQTLMMVDETPKRRAALEKALDYILNQEKPKRGSDWDIDNNWAALTVFSMLVDAAQDPRFADPKWHTRIEQRGKEYAEHLLANQDPYGGWGYYEGQVVSRRPTWSTSFATGLVVAPLVHARDVLHWPVDDKMVKRAVDYVQACALPNGAYAYSLTPIPGLNGGENINDIKGSLSRIQVCNYARREAGDPKVTDDKIREGLAQFFEFHRFLDVARVTQIPHEAYYRNAGYFYFFGHYFAARVINELPVEEREAWHAKLRAKIVPVQGGDGSSIDFPGSFYSYTYATSFSTMAMQLGLGDAARAPAHAHAAPADSTVPAAK